MTSVITAPFCLSRLASTRGTAYGFSSKSITHEGKTHVVWLDAIAKVMARTFDHESQTWGETVEIFEGCDNHTCPTITLDREGHIRLAGGPHNWSGGWNNGRFRWLRSKEPNSIAAWEHEQDFGYNATYASMSHTPDDVGVIAYRGGEKPCSLMFQRQHPKHHWLSAQELLKQDIEPQYTHVGAHIHCDRNGDLYIGGHFYNTGGGDNGPVYGDRTRMRSYGAAVIRSDDMGATWTDMHGRPLAMPQHYSHEIAAPPVDGDARMAGLQTDSIGRLWVLTSSPRGEALILSHWTGDAWKPHNLSRYLPQGHVTSDAVMTIDTADRIHVAATVVKSSPVANDGSVNLFGHPSSEIYHFRCAPSLAGIECNQVSHGDPNVAHWLPNISQPTVFCPVEKPVLLYTSGEAGVGCKPTDVLSEVYCRFLD